VSQNKTDWEGLLHDLELRIRSGGFDHVRRQLLNPRIFKCPRSIKARLSNLARRAQRPGVSLRLLHPLVHPKVKGHGQASDEEKLEYAYALQRLGAKHESFAMLESLRHFGKAHLALAFHHIAQWDYRLALGSLDSFLGGKSLTPYDELVAQVNRLACMVALGEREAETLYSEISGKVFSGKSLLLQGNVLEIMAQHWTGLGNFKESRCLLKQAEKLMAEQEDVHRLFVEKWTVIGAALEERDPAGLMHLRPRALKLGHWETLRDLDFYQSMLEPEGLWAPYVYFGTPFAHFRRRLEKLRDFPEETWVARVRAPQAQWDPWHSPGAHGELVHRFLALLTRDFYRPARIAELFSALFPEQHFDIGVSPNRIHQLASRARDLLKQESVPARLLEEGGAYSLRWPEQLALRVRKRMIGYTKAEFTFGRYRSGVPLALTAAEWSERLGFKLEKAKRLLKEAADEGLVEVRRKGQYSSYILKPGA